MQVDSSATELSGKQMQYEAAYMWSLKYDTNEHIYETRNRASLVAQWLRIRLPMQGTLVQSLVWEDAMGQLSP